MNIVSPTELLEILKLNDHWRSKNFVTIDTINGVHTIVLDNVSIEGKINIPNNVIFGYNLKFTNKSIINQINFGRFADLTFEDSKIKAIHLSGSSDGKIGSIFLKNESEIELLILSDNAKINALYLDESSKIDMLRLDEKSIVESIFIDNNSILETCYLHRDSLIENIECRYGAQINSIHCIESKIEKINNFHWGYIGEIYIKHSYINEINGSENSFTGKISLIENSKADILLFDEGSKIGGIIVDCHINKLILCGSVAYLNIENLVLNNLIVLKNSTIEKLNLEKNNSGSLSLFIENSNIAFLSISKAILINSDIINITDSNIHSISFNSLRNYGSIYISGISVLKEWDQYHKTKYEEVIIEKEDYYPARFKSDRISKDTNNSYISALSIINSNLGDTHFINCDFNLFGEIIFLNSKLLDCFLASTSFPDQKGFKIINSSSKSDLENQKRLFYGQLKSIYFAQGDYARGSLAQSFELEAYRNQLIHETAKFNFHWYDWFQFWRKEKQFVDINKDKIVLSLNSWTSNYGTNWLKAASRTLLILFVFFGIYCFLLGYRPGCKINKFMELTSYSFQYLNPFRDEDSGDFFKQLSQDFTPLGSNISYKIPWVARIWDYFSRIVISFMVYQTISAFRKLGKSNA